MIAMLFLIPVQTLVLQWWIFSHHVTYSFKLSLMRLSLTCSAMYWLLYIKCQKYHCKYGSRNAVLSAGLFMESRDRLLIFTYPLSHGKEGFTNIIINQWQGFMMILALKWRKRFVVRWSTQGVALRAALRNDNTNVATLCQKIATWCLEL